MGLAALPVTPAIVGGIVCTPEAPRGMVLSNDLEFSVGFGADLTILDDMVVMSELPPVAGALLAAEVMPAAGTGAVAVVPGGSSALALLFESLAVALGAQTVVTPPTVFSMVVIKLSSSCFLSAAEVGLGFVAESDAPVSPAGLPSNSFMNAK